VTTPGAAGVRPFVLTTAHRAPGAVGAGPDAGELQNSIMQLDAQLQQLADQLAAADAARETLQAQFNETSALLAQLIQQHEASGG
jgi:hypothetical protein